MASLPCSDYATNPLDLREGPEARSSKLRLHRRVTFLAHMNLFTIFSAAFLSVSADSQNCRFDFAALAARLMPCLVSASVALRCSDQQWGPSCCACALHFRFCLRFFSRQFPRS